MKAMLILVSLISGDNLFFEKAIPLKNCDSSRVVISLGAAKLKISSWKDNELRVTASYPKGIVDYFTASEVEDNPCEIRINGALRKDIKFENWEKLAQRSIDAAIKLPRDIPLNLEINHGLAEASVDLGNLRLRSLECTFGAGKTVIDFSMPNREELRKFEVDHGLASLKLLNLGNANFKKLSLEHGLSRLYLDLSGKWNHDAEIDISCALASIEIVAPAELGVHIEMEGLLSSKDLEGVIETDDGYRTENYEEAKHRVTIKIEGALNLIDFRVREKF